MCSASQGSGMKIWHDDLGIQDDPHEMRVQMFCPGWVPVWGQVTGGDAAVAAGECNSNWTFKYFYETIRSLMLAGF